MIVKIILLINWVKFPSINLWWAQVTVTPDERRIKVLRRGILKGLNGVIPVGGQNKPTSKFGDKLLWKKAQKNEKKNSTSEVINKIIPHFNPLRTLEV
jgi:hypothetical protein